MLAGISHKHVSRRLACLPSEGLPAVQDTGWAHPGKTKNVIRRRTYHDIYAYKTRMRFPQVGRWRQSNSHYTLTIDTTDRQYDRQFHREGGVKPPWHVSGAFCDALGTSGDVIICVIVVRLVLMSNSCWWRPSQVFKRWNNDIVGCLRRFVRV